MSDYIKIYDIESMTSDEEVKELPDCHKCGGVASYATNVAPFTASTKWLCSECAEVQLYAARVEQAQSLRATIAYHLRNLNKALAEAEANRLNVRLIPVVMGHGDLHTSTLVAHYTLSLFED